MIGAVASLLVRLAMAALIAVVFSAVLGIPYELGLAILLALVALDYLVERSRREPDPPEQPESPFEQTGGFPRSRR